MDFRTAEKGFNLPQRNRHLCALNRGLQNLESSRKGDVFTFFSLLRKEPKVAQRVATLWTPRDGSKLYRIISFVNFRLSSLNRYMVRPAFLDVLNRCERVIVQQTQDRYFSKMGCYSTSLRRQAAFKKGSCSLSLLRWKLKIVVC